MIVYYESQPTGKAELLVANVVSIYRGLGAIAGKKSHFNLIMSEIW
jgi:hypothetical protein